MRRATAADVARDVGCSISAVSLVVNGRDAGRIAPGLRGRILEAVARLDYRPNQGAKDLVRGTPSTVAFVCPDIRNPFFGDMFGGISDTLGGRYGIQLHVGSHGADYDLETVRGAQAGAIAGLIMANPAARVLVGFRPTCPTVLVDSPTASADLSTVNLDLGGGGTSLAEHLLALGHRRVAYLDSAKPKDTFEVRRAAFATTFSAGGGEVVAAGEAARITVDAGAEAFDRAWDGWRAAGVTALVAADDILAFGAIRAAGERGIGMPDHLSVASFNDLPFSSLISPPLTSVRFDARQMGEDAARQVLDLIAGGAVRSDVIPVTLSTRGSTSALPAVR